MTIIAVTVLLIALPSPNTIIINRQQQEASVQTNDNSTFKRYEDPFYGIQIQSPSNWRINEGEAFSTISFLPPARADSEADRPSLIISIVPTHNWSSYLNLNEYLTSVTKGYDNIYFDVKVIESSTNSTLAGKAAFKLVFTKVGFDNINYKSMEISTIIGNKAYSVTYTAEEKRYSDYLPTIQKMIDSFQLNDTNPTSQESPLSSSSTIEPETQVIPNEPQMQQQQQSPIY
jgi:eukaryotic-like serine/threonine-protein kinase